MELLLASTSPIRAELLAAAGVGFRAVAPGVDEAKLKDGYHGAAADLATRLAEAKALGVSAGEPDALVIGSDSLVEVDGRRVSKPRDRAEAEEHLRFFAGRTMELTSAAVLARGGAIRWRHAETVRLQVRPLGDAFIRDYLAAEWPAVAYCVGVFRFEGLGVQLFEAVEGSHFSVLGLPLLPLLGALRAEGVLAS
ncbi:Maf-like protein [Sphingomonas ginkgonis]|uniref:Nucleoside triphosphate pyrophosphatase n=1 Tax=Sphingomonas ginkgonis TaxID=2315330 RepID=A0A3R9X684_9SPHN|nr:Maf family protein [Sphingomonas ginkgonis]RST29758.1 Maf-like protein [Sphingomonas ginkgonis]